MAPPHLSPTLCRAVDGAGAHARVWQLHRYDLTRLRQDAGAAIEGWNWSWGRYGHSLPLTRRKLTAFGRNHENAIVVDDDGAPVEPDERLERCPYFLEIFESLPCAKSA